VTTLETDYFTHLSPALGDGSRGAVETVAMARGLADLGVRRLHLTPPQYRGGKAIDLVELRRQTDAVWRLLARAEVPLEVVRGAEYPYGERLVDAVVAAEELVTFEHDGERCLLVSLLPHAPAIGVGRFGRALRRRGIRPVLAQPECIDAPVRLDEWRDAGWRFLLALPALVGRYGGRVEDRAHAYLDAGLYELAGSDLRRPSDLEALREAHAAFLERSPRATAETEVVS